MNFELEDNILYVARRRITMRKIIWFSIFACLVVELIFFAALKFYEKTLDSTNQLQYLIHFVLKPTGLNFVTAVCYHTIEAVFKKEPVKNFAMTASVSVICFTLAFTHYQTSALLTLFCLPIFLTVMFASKNLTGLITLLNILFFGGTIFIAYSYNTEPLEFSSYYSNALIALAIIICSYIFSNILITYEMDSRTLLASTQKHQSEMFEQVKRDPLTNLYNQKFFYDSLAVAMKQCDKLCVAVIDIDNFKAVNDTYGHSIGDVVLVTLANKLRAMANDKILPARYGGEEFSIIFKEADQAEAFAKMDKLREEFSLIKFPQMDNKSVTFSCGIVGEYPHLDTNVEFFDKADEALYHAKNNGKNCTILHSEITDSPQQK